MKKLLENWRRFESALTEQSAFGPSLGVGSAARKDRDWQRLAAQDPDEALRQRRIEKERALAAAKEGLKETGITLAMLVDPTGVTGYPELGRASKLVYNEPTLMHAGEWFLALLGAIPGISAASGGARVAGRAVNVAKVVDNAGDVSRTLRSAGQQGARLADEIDDAARVAKREMADATKQLKDIAGAGGRAVSNMKLQRVEAMRLPHGQSYVIVKTSEGNIPFYKSSGTNEMADKVWVPLFGVDNGNRFLKLGEKHKDALTYMGPSRQRPGELVQKTGKYAVEGSEISNVGKALESQGAFANVSHMWDGPADFLSNNLNSLTPGMNIKQITNQLNKGLQYMNYQKLTAGTVENIAINLHMKVNNVATGLADVKAGIPGINATIDQGTLIQALEIGSQIREHLDVFTKWRKIIL